MKPDFYTKIALTVIALALVLIACNQYVHPAAAEAQGPFAGVQDTGGLTFFDAKTGEVWLYNSTPYIQGGINPGQLLEKWKLTKLGEPVTLQFCTQCKNK